MNNIRIVVKNDGTIGKVIIGEYDETEGKELFYPVNYGTYYESELELLSEIEYKEGETKDYITYIEVALVWGKIIKTHIIGEYQIIEYINNDNEKCFNPYINYNNTSHSYDSLETAITGAIAYKYDGSNSQANKFFWKMIK